MPEGLGSWDLIGNWEKKKPRVRWLGGFSLVGGLVRLVPCVVKGLGD